MIKRKRSYLPVEITGALLTQHRCESHSVVLYKSMPPLRRNKDRKNTACQMHCSVRSKRTQSTTVWCARAKHVILTPHRCMLPLSSLRFLWPSPSLPPLFHSVPPLTSLRSVSSRSIKQSFCAFLSISVSLTHSF